MKFSEFSIRRPIFVLMLISSFLVFGVTSYRSIGVSLFPDVDFPIVSVLVIYEGADPGTIETEVTDPIEEAVNTLNGIKSVRSESLEGVSQVFIEFELEVNIDVASQDVRDKIAGVRAELPREIEAPIIEKFDPASAPILTVVISGPKSIRELTKFAKDEVKPRIEGARGVGSAKLVGGREREVRVWLRSDSLFNHGLEPQAVIDALRAKNVETPGGRIETGEREIGVRTKGLLKSVRDFPSLIIAHRDGAPIRLEELGQCEDGLEEERSLSRLNGQRAVSLLIRRQSGTNLVKVAESVKAKIEDAREVLPEGFELILAQDLSVFVKQSNDEAQGELIRGGALAVFVLLIFLRSFRGAFVAAVTIPTTIIATYAFMASRLT
ncbi:MAG: efflux RND transporter permease subunit [Planctomycetota bacterium]|nr:efflux RND transporter permease subunit [Planctomycetota bacterium]